jgi:flagellar motor switch/type III secretory pathway protein FliN
MLRSLLGRDMLTRKRTRLKKELRRMRMLKLMKAHLKVKMGKKMMLMRSLRDKREGAVLKLKD